MLQGKRIFITGGAGFIGTTLARRLVADNEVVAADNLHRDALTGTDLADHPNFTFQQADVLDLDAMHELARGSTHIVHCAAIAGVDTVLESPVRTMRVNVIGTYNMLEAAVATLDSVERFIDFSTSEVFGTHAFRVEEGQVSTMAPSARRADVRRSSPGEHMALPRRAGLPAVTVHPFNVFGPGQIGAARSGLHRERIGRRDRDPRRRLQIRAWCYVDDMVAGTLVPEHPERSARLQYRQPRATVTIYDLALRIKRADGADVDITFQPPTTPTSSCGSRTSRRPAGARLRGEVDLDEGLEKTIAWYREKTLSASA